MQSAFLSEDNKLIALLVEPRYRLVRHLLLLLLLVVSYNSMMVTFIGNLSQLGNGVVYLSALQFAIYLGVVYLNIYVLMPRLFLRKRYTAYCLILFGILSLVFFTSFVIEYIVSSMMDLEPGMMSYMNSEHYIAIDYFSDVSVTGMCCAGTSVTLLFRKWLTDGKLREEMETRQLNAEIGRFKTSVNSAFMSDVLEAAAAAAPADRDRSAGLLSRLSRFLRYRLYDSERSIVMLNSETAFLENYLSLIRDLHGLLTYKISDTAGSVAVPPSLLINVTDLILSRAGESTPVCLEIKLSGKGKGCLTVTILTSFSGVEAELDWISETLRKIVGHAVPGGYSLTVGMEGNAALIVMDLKTGGV